MNWGVYLMNKHKENLKIIFSISLIFIFISTFASCSLLKRSKQEKDFKIGFEVLREKGFASLKNQKIAIFLDEKSCDQSGDLILIQLSKAKVDCGLFIIPSYVSIPTKKENTETIKLKKIITKIYPNSRVIELNESKPRPNTEDFAGIKHLIIDYQITGFGDEAECAFLSQTLESARENKIPITVLDRPNPLTGLIVTGCLPDSNHIKKWNCYLPLPHLYGLTTGELVNLLNGYYGIQGDIEIINMVGWKRLMTFKDTGLLWNSNLPFIGDSKEKIIIYSALRAIRPAELSFGEGTKFEFRVFGTPDLDTNSIINKLKSKGQSSLFDFEEVTFKPLEGIFKDTLCKGILIKLKNQDISQPLPLMIHLIQTIHSQFPQKLTSEKIDNYLKNSSIAQEIISGKPIESLTATVTSEMNSFKEARLKYLIYKD